MMEVSKMSTHLLPFGLSPTPSSRGGGHGVEDVFLGDWNTELVPFV